MNIKDFENEPSKYIWGDDCTLHIDSIFKREFTGDLNLLLSCLEDRATPSGLNYYQAIKDYRTSVKSVAIGE